MSANQEDAQSTSSQTFLSALILNSAIAGVELLIFMLIKNKFRKVYSPRSYLPPVHKRSSELPRSFFGWIPYIIKADPEQIIASNGLDAYYFVRFLRLMMWIFVPFWFLTWAVLLPVYSVKSGGTKEGLDMFTFGNVGTTKQVRYAAPLIVIWVFTFYAYWLIRREMETFIVKRQDFLISPAHSALPQSKTVLLTGVPPDMLTYTNLEKFTSYLPGGAKQIWIARDLKELPDLYERRTKAFSKLESGETKLMKIAHKLKNKENKKNKVPAGEAGTGKEHGGDVESAELWAKYVPEKQRPMHKLGFLGLFGKKVDTISWAKDEIVTTTKELDEGRSNIEQYKAHNSVFIEFNTQIAAHMFAQSLSHHMPLRMTGRWIEVAPEDVIWSTLNMAPLQQRMRFVFSWVITIGLIVLWSIPVAFVGLISNVNSLCSRVSWMAWLCKLPAPVPGILQGVLPPVALAVLFMLLPIVLRMLAIFEGIPLHSLVEVSLMSRYFMFLVIHGFLIVTLSSGLVAAIPAIADNPSSAVTLLAQELPKASTFFLTYIVTTALAGGVGALLQIGPLVVYYVKMVLLASTPRSVFNIRCVLGKVAWGTLFPNITLLAVIGLSYAVVSPLVNGFAAVAFCLYWFIYKYLFIFVYDMPASGETGGLFFPKAIGHLFVGLYIQQIFIAALFFFAQDSDGKQSALPQGALMIVLIIFTILFHGLIKGNYHPVIAYLPISLAGKIEENQGMGPPGSDRRTPSPHEKQTLAASGSPMGAGDYEKAGHASKNADAVGSSAQTGERDLGKHAFDHPAQWQNLSPAWIPKDSFGLGDAAIRDLRQSGIDASDSGAEMNDQGKVFVTKNPPGEDHSFDLPPNDK